MIGVTVSRNYWPTSFIGIACVVAGIRPFWYIGTCVCFSFMNGAGIFKRIVVFMLAVLTLLLQNTSSFKPSAHSTIFAADDKDLVFCRQRRKRNSSMFDIEDHRQRKQSLMLVSRTQQVFVASDKNLGPQRQKSCCVS